MWKKSYGSNRRRSEKGHPHVYSAIIDKDTGNTRPEEVRQLLQLMKKIVE